MEMMRVLQATKPFTPEYITLPKPVPKDDEVIIKVVRAGICATDIAILTGEAFFMKDGSTDYPVRFGHEFSGIVDSVGKDVKGFKPGDRVITNNGVSCGVCGHCRNGRHDLCVSGYSVGTINTWPGSYAEYVMFPQRHVYHMPDTMDFDTAALVEPTTISVGGVLVGEVKPGKTVLVIGTGAIGQGAVALAKASGADQVFLSGRSDDKLAVGLKMGADGVVNVRNTPLVDYIMEKTGGKGADVIIECSGNVNVMDDCNKAIAKNGILACCGFFEAPLNNFDIDGFVGKMAQLRGVMGRMDYVPATLDLVTKYNIDLLPSITSRITFDQCAETMLAMTGPGSKKDIKVMVHMD